MQRFQIDRYKRQLLIYAYLIENYYGKKVSKLRLYYTAEKDGNPYVNFDYNRDEVNQTITWFDNVVGEIENKNFTVCNRDLKVCRECDFRFYCNKTK